MKYEIEYSEVIKRVNSVIIEVASEEEGEDIAEKLEKQESKWNHPDDIFYALDDLGVEVTDREKGAEDCEYEIV